MNLMVWCFIVATICFGIVFLMNSYRDSKIDKINPEEKIKIGKYLYGFANYNLNIFCICAVKDNHLHFYDNALGNKMAEIPIVDIVDFTIVDKSTIINNKWFIEDKKFKKIDSFNLLITWKLNEIIQKTYFEIGVDVFGEFKPAGADVANATLQKLLKYLPNKLKFETSEKDAISVADEIKKLSELKSSGILTDEEFENQKSKLLNS